MKRTLCSEQLFITLLLPKTPGIGQFAGAWLLIQPWAKSRRAAGPAPTYAPIRLHRRRPSANIVIFPFP
jgi:hypothetical protein